ncbi:hypothetical protein AAHC03_022633 [Spirometra sp. Aus1]
MSRWEANMVQTNKRVGRGCNFFLGLAAKSSTLQGDVISTLKACTPQENTGRSPRAITNSTACPAQGKSGSAVFLRDIYYNCDNPLRSMLARPLTHAALKPSRVPFRRVAWAALDLAALRQGLEASRCPITVTFKECGVLVQP